MAFNVFSGFLKTVLTQSSFQNHRLLFSHASEVRNVNHAGKKVCINRVSNSQPLGGESITFTTEPPAGGALYDLRSTLSEMMRYVVIISCFPVGYREISVKIFFDLTLVPPVKIPIFMFWILIKLLPERVKSMK